MPSNTKNKSQHDGKKELKYFFFAVGFRRDKLSVTREKDIFSALQTFDRKFVTPKIFVFSVLGPLGRLCRCLQPKDACDKLKNHRTLKQSQAFGSRI